MATLRRERREIWGNFFLFDFRAMAGEVKFVISGSFATLMCLDLDTCPQLNRNFKIMFKLQI